MRLKAMSTMIPRAVLTMTLVCCLATGAWAASSITNSLSGFTGNSTLPATQTAVSAAGFNFYSTAGLNDPDFTMDPTVVFDATGANFGTLFGGDGGRNYMRTNDSDYATVSFVAEITFETSDLDLQDAFIGMGAGDTALFGWPDWSTQFSSVILTPEINVTGLLTTMYTTNDTPIFANNDAPGLGAGINRLQMTYDAGAKTVVFSADYNYTGGAFVADASTPAVDVSTLFAPSNPYGAEDYTVWRDTLGSTTDLRANWDNTGTSIDLIDEADYAFWLANYGQAQSAGWPSEPSRIFFGGDDGVKFRDFKVTVGAGAGGVSAVPEPTSALLLILSAAGLLVARRQR